MNQFSSEYKFSSKIAECFHFNKNECNDIIKRSHSIQKNGRLSLLEEDVNGNQKLYSFTNCTLNRSCQTELKPIGKAEASIFYGFCDYHDNVLFSKIEDTEFKGTDEECFLFSYRAFAYIQHGKKEELKGLNSESQLTKHIGNQLQNSIAGTNTNYSEGEDEKLKMNEILKTKNFDRLDYLIIDLDDFHPIACSSSMTPTHTPKTNSPINVSLDPNIKYEKVFFNIIPDLNGTKILLACFPEDEKSVKYLDEFESLSLSRIKIITSSIMVGYIENTFISPFIYNRLSKHQKSQLFKELIETSYMSPKPLNKHFISKINFFQSKFVKKYT